MIRFGVAAAAVLTFLPAWGSDASVEERLESQPYEQQVADSAARPPSPQYASAPQDSQPCAGQGSGGGEPASEEEDRKEDRQQDAQQERFLNDTWNTP